MYGEVRFSRSLDIFHLPSFYSAEVFKISTIKFRFPLFFFWSENGEGSTILTDQLEVFSLFAPSLALCTQRISGLLHMERTRGESCVKLECLEMAG